jgi:peroxiredoxin
MCRAFVAQLRAVYPQLEAEGVQIVAMTMGQPAETDRFCTDQELDFVCLSDPARVAYDTYGLMSGAANLAATSIRPNNWLAFAREALKGNMPGLAPHGQTLTQLSGTFIIDRAGIVRYAQRSRYAADLATGDELVAAVQSTLLAANE